MMIAAPEARSIRSSSRVAVAIASAANRPAVSRISEETFPTRGPDSWARATDPNVIVIEYAIVIASKNRAPCPTHRGQLRYD